MRRERLDVFLTVDRNLSYQQDLSAFNIAVVVIVAPGNRLVDLPTADASRARGPALGRAWSRDSCGRLMDL
jgi:hypothetical protein